MDRPGHPQRERKRIIRLLIEDVTLDKTDQIHLHVRFRGGQTTSLTIPIPPNAWQARQTSPDTLAASTGSSTTTPTTKPPQQLNLGGHRSGDGQTIHRPHRAPPAHQQQPAQPRTTGSAPKDCSPSPRSPHRLGVHPTTIKNWHKAGLLTSHKANDKNERLYQPPAPGDPSLIARQGSPIRNRVPAQPAPGGAL